MSPYQRPQDMSISLQDLRPFLCTLLDQVCSYMYPPQLTKSRDQLYLDQLREQIKSHISSEVERAISVFSRNKILEEAISLLNEQMDVMVESYQSGFDEVTQAFSDEGLIEVNLENKEKKWKIIHEFLVANELYDPKEDIPVRAILNKTIFNLYTAKIVKE